MANPKGEIVAACPHCNKPIGDKHSDLWCIECGNTLPREILAQIPGLAQFAAAAAPSSQSETPKPPEQSSKEIQSLLNRYTDSYRVARVTVGFGGFIKFIGIALALVIVAGGILMANQPQTAFGGFPGMEPGARSLNLPIVIGSLIWACIVGIFFYIWGVLISAQGQILKASLDGAVNSSPFLTNQHRAKIMSL